MSATDLSQSRPAGSSEPEKGMVEPTDGGAGVDLDPGRAPFRALVRFAGEVTTKARGTRHRFQERLARNCRDALRSHGIEGRVRKRWSRLFVEAEDPAARELLARVFGVSSFSPLEGECPAELEAIVETGARLYSERVRGRTYAVRARRAGDHPFRSYDVQRDLGAALNPGAEVDLDDPEVEVRVEVRDERAYLFSERVRGAGGLPLGVQGKALCLISGGYDSAVAAWMTLRRGVEVEYLFCNLGGGAYERLTLEVAKVLADRWSYGTSPRLHVVDFGPLVEQMRRRIRSSHLQVVLKRLMYRAGSRVAAGVGADALVTGESVGQVSSQTLANLRAIDGASALPVLRPLVGFDKEEIVERSREIGTAELSARVREYCAISSDHPVTAADPRTAAVEEGKLDEGLLDEVMAGRRSFDLRELERSDIVSPHLFVDEIEDDAVVVDVRDDRSFAEWHWPGARRRDFEELARDFEELDRERTYVLCCRFGTRTAHLAERMQAAGYEAYSFRGGVGGLRRYAAGREEE